MKKYIICSVLGLSNLLISCSSDEQKSGALQEGYVENALIYEHPVLSSVSTNTPIQVKKGSKVELYNSFIMIYLEEDIKQIISWDYVKELTIK